MRWTPGRPFSLQRWAERLTRWGDDPVHVVADGVYHRVHAGAPYRVRQFDDGSFECDGDGGALQHFQSSVAANLSWAPVDAMALREPRVKALLERHRGFRPVITPDPFEAVVGLVSAQQVNLRWALETKSRLVRRFGTAHALGGVEVWEFPSPDRLAAAGADQVRELQFTTRKAEYIVGLAADALVGRLDVAATESNESALHRLTRLRGVGRWTAEQLLARCWARPDVVAAGDLGVRKAVSTHWAGVDGLLSEEEVRAVVEPWGDAANLVSQLLLEELVAR